MPTEDALDAIKIIAIAAASSFFIGSFSFGFD